METLTSTSHPFTECRSHQQNPYNQNNHDGHSDGERTQQRVRIGGSPLFGVDELEEESRFRGALPQQDEQVKGYPTGAGELSLLCPATFEEDILVDPLPAHLPFDSPLALTTPSLSPEVLSVESAKKTDPLAMYDVDFALFTVGQLQPQLPFYPPTSSFAPRASTSSASTFHAPSSFAHLQTRAVAFDQSLQSPLGESPLILPCHSVSPQLSDGNYWSPEDLIGGGGGDDFDYSGSPLLVNNLEFGETRGNGLAGLFDPATIAQNHFRYNPTSGPVSGYTAATSSVQLPPRLDPSSPQLPPQLDIRRDSNPIAFSPIMGQRTYDNLFNECTTSLIATDSLPPLPPPSSHKSISEPVIPGSATEEEDNNENENDTEWIPSHANVPPPPTRSTCRRTSFSPPPLLNTRKSTAPPVLPLDAPIQTRHYQVSSRTSRKPIPKALQRANEKAIQQRGKGFSEEYLESEADRRRRLNTLSARESRKRKTEAIEQQARENVELKEENEGLRERVGQLEKENEFLRRRIGDDLGGGKRIGKRARGE
ncbi:hypothetical protein JCM5353_002346 [Sporobolomyces roseus]